MTHFINFQGDDGERIHVNVDHVVKVTHHDKNSVTIVLDVPQEYPAGPAATYSIVGDEAERIVSQLRSLLST